MTSIAIIGTAGRKNDYDKLSKIIYEKMFLAAKKIVEPVRNLHLVSGGAAWADHLAVSLYLANVAEKLTLHFPCEWDENHHRFVDAGFRSPGNTANYYHRKFSQKMSGNNAATLMGLQAAINKGANVVAGNGFFSRNKEIAKSDVILAFTFGEGDVPKDGGTKHTWDHATTKNKIHIPITSL